MLNNKICLMRILYHTSSTSSDWLHRIMSDIILLCSWLYILLCCFNSYFTLFSVNEARKRDSIKRQSTKQDRPIPIEHEVLVCSVWVPLGRDFWSENLKIRIRNLDPRSRKDKTHWTNRTTGEDLYYY